MGAAVEASFSFLPGAVWAWVDHCMVVVLPIDCVKSIGESKSMSIAFGNEM